MAAKEFTKEEKDQLKAALAEVREQAQSVRNLLRVSEKDMPSIRKVLSDKATALSATADEILQIVSGEGQQ